MAKGGPRETKQSKQLGKGLAGAGFLLLRTISNFAYEMIYNQIETARTAVSGSGGMDAVASGSSGWTSYIHFISEI